MIFPTERVQNGVLVLAKLLHPTRSLGPLQKQASNPESKAKQVLSKKAGEAKAAKEQTNKQRNKENSCTSSSLCGRKADLLGRKRTALRAADFRTGLHDLHQATQGQPRIVFVVSSKQRAVRLMSKRGKIGTLLHAWSICA